MMTAYLEQFRRAMESSGIAPPDTIVDDGALHRFRTNGHAHDDAGWYVLHADGVPAGAFGDFRAGVSETFRADIGRELTQQEQRAQRKRLEAIRRQREAEEVQRQAEAAGRAKQIWQAAAPPAADHPYLVRKGVKAHGLRIYRGELEIRGMRCDGALIVPLRDSKGDIRSLEFIGQDGEKRFLAGGKKSGTYHSIGKLNGTLVVCEGYATGASVHEATGHAVAIAMDAGNLVTVAKAMRAKFSGAKLIIAADNDESDTGQRAGEDAARAAGGFLAVPQQLGRDWNDVAVADGADAVRAGVEAAAAVESQESRESQPPREQVKSAPEALRRSLPPADPYPLEALGPILSAAVQRAHEIIRAPAAICGQSFLAAASLAAQAHADVEIDGRRELLSLFGLTIGESGERKSGVDTVALAMHREFERKALKEFEAELQHYENALAAHEAAKKLITKQRPKEIPPGELADYIQQQLERLGKPPAPPKKPIFFTASPTLEGLHKLFVAGRPSIGLFHDDAGEFIGGHAMSDDNRLKSAAGLSKLWDRGEFDRVRAGDGANKYFGRRVASHLMIQPVVAERVLSDDILTQQGLLARTLLAWPQSTIGDRPYVEIDISKDPALIEYHRTIAALLERPNRFAEGSQEELDPPVLRLRPEAKQVWVEVHNAIEADQKDGGEYSSIRPWASKAPAQILRIAGVLTVVEQPNATVIDVDMVTKAATLMKYYLGEAARIVGTSVVPEHVRQAEALLDWCRRERKAEIYSREVLQFGPNAIRSVESFDKVITVLERTGWAVPIEGGKTLAGKHRRRVWTIRLEEAS